MIRWLQGISGVVLLLLGFTATLQHVPAAAPIILLGWVLTVRFQRSSPATARQRAYADNLGISYTPSVTRHQMSDLISAAVAEKKRGGRFR